MKGLITLIPFYLFRIILIFFTELFLLDKVWISICYHNREPIFLCWIFTLILAGIILIPFDKLKFIKVKLEQKNINLFIYNTISFLFLLVLLWMPALLIEGKRNGDLPYFYYYDKNTFLIPTIALSYISFLIYRAFYVSSKIKAIISLIMFLLISCFFAYFPFEVLILYPKPSSEGLRLNLLFMGLVPFFTFSSLSLKSWILFKTNGSRKK